MLGHYQAMFYLFQSITSLFHIIHENLNSNHLHCRLDCCRICKTKAKSHFLLLCPWNITQRDMSISHGYLPLFYPEHDLIGG